MRARLTGLWRHADFRRLWLAQTVSLFGSEISALAIPVAAALALGATPGQMGLLRAAGTAPYLALGLLAGVWVDRWRRRPVMIGADLGRALLLGTIPAAALLHALGLPLLFAVAPLAGTLTLCFDVAAGAYLPGLLGREDLVEGNGKLAASVAAAEGAGPGLAGVLVQLLTAPLAIVLDVLSFLASALLLGAIRAPEPAPEPARAGRSLRRELAEGLGAIVRDPILRATAAMSGVLNLSGGLTDALLVYYITVTLGLPPIVIGLFFAVGSASGLLGTLVGQGVARRLGPGPTIVLAAGLIGVGWLTVPLAAGPPPVLVPALVSGALLAGLGNTSYNLTATSVRQAITPARLLGRVGACQLFVAYGALPLGALLGGALGAWLGVREALLLAMLARLPLLLALALASPLPGLRALPGTGDGSGS